jgi:hypothetical protein
MNGLAFNYINHDGILHTYKVIPVGLEFGLCKCFPNEPLKEAWILKCLVLERSGEKRNVMRSFAIVKLMDTTEFAIGTG